MNENQEPYTVIVGVSATSKSPAALAWGQAQAEANGGRMIAIRVHPAPRSGQGAPGTSNSATPEAQQQRERQLAELESDVAEVLGEGHGVETRVVYGGKRRALLNEAEQADLLVIDAPQAPSMTPLLAQRVVYAATCPVVVMPPSISGVPPSPLTKSARAVGRAALRSAGTSGRAGYRPPISQRD